MDFPDFLLDPTCLGDSCQHLPLLVLQHPTRVLKATLCCPSSSVCSWVLRWCSENWLALKDTFVAVFLLLFFFFFLFSVSGSILFVKISVLPHVNKCDRYYVSRV